MRKGFSLIELLIVIAIIGIIATIAIPILLTARNAAIDEKGRNSLRTFVSANAAFYAQNGRFADDGAELVADSFLDARWTDIAGDDHVETWSYTVVGGQTYTAVLTVASPDATVYTATETGEITET